MADARFFNNVGPFKLGELLKVIDREAPQGFEDHKIDDISVLSKAEKTHISYLKDKKLLKDLEKSNVGFCLITPELKEKAPSNIVAIESTDPHFDFVALCNHFYPEDETAEIHETAVIHETATIGKNTAIGPYAVIGKGVTIGDNCTIEPHTHITHALVGNNVKICTGAQIGRRGFGFVHSEKGVFEVKHLGRVILEDHVEIGSNTTVDRGVGDDTHIGMGTKIDSLVQIGHNVKLGKFCFLAGQVGISGSTTVGDFVHMGGQVGIADHLTIGSNVKIAARSGLMHDVEDNQNIAGAPAIPMKQFIRQVITLKKLSEGSK